MVECDAFMQKWEDDPNDIKSIFMYYRQLLDGWAGVSLSFKARPGISYSLRGACPESERDMFVMVDVVDDDPEDRWLSVCFYDDQVTDPDERGDWAPSGLGDLDARCFNLETPEPALVAYTEARIREAWQAVRPA